VKIAPYPVPGASPFHSLPKETWYQGRDGECLPYSVAAPYLRADRLDIFKISISRSGLLYHRNPCNTGISSVSPSIHDNNLKNIHAQRYVTCAIMFRYARDHHLGGVPTPLPFGCRRPTRLDRWETGHTSDDGNLGCLG